jgi:hypothetical protein
MLLVLHPSAPHAPLALVSSLLVLRMLLLHRKLLPKGSFIDSEAPRGPPVIRELLWPHVGEEHLLIRVEIGAGEPGTQRLRCQYLCLCTSKAS